MGLRVPRIVFCSTESVCSCVWLNWMHTDCASFVHVAAGIIIHTSYFSFSFSFSLLYSEVQPNQIWATTESVTTK